MKRILCYCFFLSLLCCEKYPGDLEYDYAIAKSYYCDSTFFDSTTFYYDSGNRLLHVDHCYVQWSCNGSPVIYNNHIIESQFGTFYMDEENRVNKWIYGNAQVDYQYAGGIISHEQTTINDRTENEHYYTYDDLNLLQDSGVYYAEPGKGLSTVYKYRYADTIAPVFLIGFSGLFEYPSRHRYLVRESESTEHGILYKYTYEISDNKLVEHKQLFDMFYNTSHGTWTTKYYLLH
jgi:hypothetical protein